MFGLFMLTVTVDRSAFCGIPAPTMSLISKSTKVKPKGTIQELKIVPSVTRRGVDTLAMEEVRTPRRVNKTASSSRPTSQSSSPAKRQRQDGFDPEPLPYALAGSDENGKRRTLVFIFA
jgi:hypothetical protein